MRYIPFFDSAIQLRLPSDVRDSFTFHGESINVEYLCDHLGSQHDQTIVEQLIEGTSSIDLHASYRWMRSWKLAMHYAMGEGGAINNGCAFYDTQSTQDMQFVNLKHRFAVLSHRVKFRKDGEWAYLGLVVRENAIVGATVIGVEEDSAEMRGYIEAIESADDAAILETFRTHQNRVF